MTTGHPTDSRARYASPADSQMAYMRAVGMLMAIEKALGKHFAALELSALLRRTDQAEPSTRKLIRDTQHQGLLGSNNGQIGSKTRREVG